LVIVLSASVIQPVLDSNRKAIVADDKIIGLY
jgi:hypothetical protein